MHSPNDLSPENVSYLLRLLVSRRLSPVVFADFDVQKL